MTKALAAVPLVLLALAAPAYAVGTGGIEFTPDPATAGGKTVTAFHVALGPDGESVQRYHLRNLTDRPVTVRLYAAAAGRSPSGAYAVAGPGSAPWIALPDRSVTLPPRGEQRGSFTVSAAASRYGAIVVERASSSVVTRAATLVYLEGEPATGGESNRTAALVAAALAALVGSALAVTARRERQRRVVS